MKNRSWIKKTTAIIMAAFMAAAAGFCGFAEEAASKPEQKAAVEEPLYSGEEYEGLLPIGSVVLLKEGEVKLMIMGYLASLIEGDQDIIYDYTGVIYPSGYEDADNVYLFNHSNIDKIYFVGYQNADQEAYMQKVYAFIASLKE